MRISVVIPMYNEEKGIEQSLRTLHAALEKELAPSDFEILAVNDGSTDRTGALVSALCGELSCLRLVELSKNSGKGGALKEGMTKARGAFVLFTDSDLAYGTKNVLSFLSAFEEGKGQAILGSRALAQKGYTGYSFLRKALSKGYLQLIKLVAGFSYSDSQCGIKGFERSLAHALFSELETAGFAFDLEILLALKDQQATVFEMPVRIINHGTSSVHPVRDSIRMFRDLLTIKKRRKERLKRSKSN
jgi:dolichyl-phosphate beta-glucosyltransferase